MDSSTRRWKFIYARRMPIHITWMLKDRPGFLKIRGHRQEAATYFARALAIDSKLSDIRDELSSVGVNDDAALDAYHLRGGLAGGDIKKKPFNLLTRLRTALPLKQARAAARRMAWPQAEENYRKILKQDPDQVRCLVQCGHALREQGKAEEAVDCYRRALLLTPRDPDIYIYLGAALKHLGRIDSALGAYLAAWRLRPGLPAAVQEIRAISGDLEDGQIAELSGMYLRVDPSQHDGTVPVSNENRGRQLSEVSGLDREQSAIFKFLAGSLAYKE